MQRTAHIALAILKIHVHVLCHTHMPKPQANNTLRTNKVPATAPCSAHTHTVGLLLPPTMPPGVQSKCHPREKGLSAGAASEEAPTILLGPVEACMYTRTHTHTHQHLPLPRSLSLISIQMHTHSANWIKWLAD